MYYYGPMMNGYGWGILMSVVWLLFFIFVAVIIARLLGGHSTDARHGADPLDIAKERYAKGEITKEQFEQIKKGLA